MSNTLKSYLVHWFRKSIKVRLPKDWGKQRVERHEGRLPQLQPSLTHYLPPAVPNVRFYLSSYLQNFLGKVVRIPTDNLLEDNLTIFQIFLDSSTSKSDHPESIRCGQTSHWQAIKMLALDSPYNYSHMIGGFVVTLFLIAFGDLSTICLSTVWLGFRVRTSQPWHISAKLISASSQEVDFIFELGSYTSNMVSWVRTPELGFLLREARTYRANYSRWSSSQRSGELQCDLSYEF